MNIDTAIRKSLQNRLGQNQSVSRHNRNIRLQCPESLLLPGRPQRLRRPHRQPVRLGKLLHRTFPQLMPAPAKLILDVEANSRIMSFFPFASHMESISGSVSCLSSYR